MTLVERVLAKLDGVARMSSGYSARCPGHDDARASLTIAEGIGGRVLLHCHTGCAVDAIVAALGLAMRDLMPPHDSGRARRTVYPVCDTDGTLVAEHVREDTPTGKRMWWRLPNASRAGLGGRRVETLPLYRTETLADLADDSLVVLVEGEKCTDALAARAIPAIGTVTGAHGTPCEDALRTLAGRHVVLWPDADGIGRDHMQRIAARLVACGANPRWYDAAPEAADGRDAADDTRDAEALSADLYAAPVWTPNGIARDEVHQEEIPSVGVLLSEVEPEQVSWLWSGRIPLAKMSVLEGKPDVGKTLVLLDVAARTTTGAPMPFEAEGRKPAGVVILTAEDGLGDTIRPRLEAASADLTRVVAARLDELPSLDDVGLRWIQQAITRVSAKLVIIDPLAAFVPDKRDTHKDHDMRRTLTPVAALAASTGAAIVMIRHHTKGQKTDAKDAGGMSVAIGAAARSVYVAATDPDDPDRRVLARVKCNLAAPVPSLAYQLVPVGSSVRVEWIGTSEHTADALVNTVPERDDGAIADAETWLRDFLAKAAKPARDVYREARKDGIADRTLERTKARLKIRSQKGPGGWTWALSSRSPTSPGGNLGDLGDLGHVEGVL
jgi:RecA-family ATPase